MLLVMWGLLIAADPVATIPVPPPLPILPAKKAKPREICHDDPADTGSHMKRHLCMTAEQWQIRAEGKSFSDLKGIEAH